MQNQIILLIALVSLFSCRKDSNELKHSFITQDINKGGSKLIGTWVLSGIQWEKVTDSTVITNSAQCNKCPEFRFGIDNKGLIKTGTGTLEKINWKGNKQSLQIIIVSSGNNSDLVQNPVLEDGSYKIRFKDSIGYKEVILINSKGVKYILEKE